MRRSLLLAAGAFAGFAGGMAVMLPADADAAKGRGRASPARDCFNARSVDSFRPAGRDAVIVRVSRNRQYRLMLGGYCPDIDGALQIALRTRAGASFVCAGLDAELLLRGPAGPQRCVVTEVRRLTAAEIETERR